MATAFKFYYYKYQREYEGSTKEARLNEKHEPTVYDGNICL
jgi:hypothetical protein